MLFEPEGAVLSYLCAGAPTVVGNLWDVTDRDIDKFSISFLEKMYKGEDNIPASVAKSRHVCRMKNLVGCAPVVYGIPVVIGKRSQSNEVTH
jgi:separase